MSPKNMINGYTQTPCKAFQINPHQQKLCLVREPLGPLDKQGMYARDL